LLINEIVKHACEKNPEDHIKIRARVDLAKDTINNFISKNNISDDEVAILTHSGILEYWTAEDFDNEGAPQKFKEFENLEVHSAKF